MNDQKKTNAAAPPPALSEADRMAKIRELLVGPVIADESARVDKSLERLAHEQTEAIAALQGRVSDLEESQRVGMKQLQIRLLGIVEALLADEEELRTRVARNETLLPKVQDRKENRGH